MRTNNRASQPSWRRGRKRSKRGPARIIGSRPPHMAKSGQRQPPRRCLYVMTARDAWPLYMAPATKSRDPPRWRTGLIRRDSHGYPSSAPAAQLSAGPAAIAGGFVPNWVGTSLPEASVCYGRPGSAGHDRVGRRGETCCASLHPTKYD